MKEILKLDFSRCLNSKQFKYCFSILLTLSLFSYAILFKQTFKCNSLELQKTTNLSIIINSGDIRSIFHTFILIAPLICVLMYSDSFINERYNKIYIMFVTRIGKKYYLLSKAVTVFIVAFLSVFFVLALNEILTLISIPNIGILSQDGMLPYLSLVDNEPEFFLQNIYDKFPYIYNFLIISIISLFSAMSALIAFNLSVILKINKAIMLIISFLIVNGTEMFLPEKYQIQMYIQTWPGNFTDFLFVILGWLLISIGTLILGIKKEIIS